MSEHDPATRVGERANGRERAISGPRADAPATGDSGEPGRYAYPFCERHEVVPFVPNSARTVLDVGCGLGGFGSALRRVGLTRTIWGVESHAEAARAAQPHYDRVLEGFFPDVMEGDETRFDCVVFNDVLEHMVDPWSALRSGTGMLTPGGVVLASIPNVRFLRTVVDLALRGDWEYTGSGVLDRTHLRFFTRKTCRTLFDDAGLEIVSLRGINWIGHSRFPRLSRLVPVVLRDFSYTGFLIKGSPGRRMATERASRTE